MNRRRLILADDHTLLRAARGPSGWLCRSGSRLLRCAARLDRPARTVQWDGLNVRLINPHTGQLLREHLRQKRGWHRIQEADCSPRTPPSTLQLLERASRAGTHIGNLCQAIHQQYG